MSLQRSGIPKYAPAANRTRSTFPGAVPLGTRLANWSQANKTFAGSERLLHQQELLRSTAMSLGTILLIILILALLGALPTWPYSSGWGYYPTGGLGLILLIVIILLVLGRI
jgi:hypothetical protein